MADQSEKVVLEAEDEVTPVVGKANASLDSFEKKAESSHGTVIRISDQTRSSVQRLIASLEKQADVYGKSGVDKLIAQRDQLLQRYAKEPAAIDAITRSYERMIATQKRIDSEAKFEGFGEKVKQFIESPLQGAKGILSSVLSSMGPFGVAIAGGAAVLGSLALAGFEAAKSLGEYGMRIKDAELRTGLTAKEVVQFGFAARAAGQDIGIFERMMRGLSQAADDTSKEGEKARSTLQRMGVTMVDAHTGALKPTAEVLQEIAEGLNRLPVGFERDSAAMALFKRAGVEAIPVISELSENLAIARQNGYGASEEDVKRMMQYQREVTEAEMAWERFARSIKEPLAATVIFTAKWVGAAWNLASLPFKVMQQGMFGGKRMATDEEMEETEGWGYGASMSIQYHREEQAAINRNDQMVAAAKASGEDRLSTAEKKLADLQGELKTGVLPEVNEPVLKQIEAQRQLIAGIKAQTEASKELKEWERQAAEFEKKSDEAELDAIGKIYYQRDQLLHQGAKVKASEKELAEIRKSADEQANKIYNKSREEFEKYDATRERGPNLKPYWEDQLKEWKAEFEARNRVEDIGVEAQKAELQRRAGRAARMAELTGGSDEEIAQQTYQTRIDLALQLAGIESARVAKEDDANKKSVMAAQAQKDLYSALMEAQDQFDEKQLQIQQKREQEQQQELQSQFDGLQKQAEHLFDVLFTKPKNFGKDLVSTIHAAVIKPVVEMASSGAASLLHPLIYGSDGKGGLNAMFHPNQDPVTLSTNENTQATRQNSLAIAAMTAVLAHASGISAPMVGSVPGLPGLSVPSISAPSISAMAAPRLSAGSMASNNWGYSPVANVLALPGVEPGVLSAWPQGWSSAGTDANGLPISSSNILPPPMLAGWGRPSRGAPRAGFNLGSFNVGALQGAFSKNNWFNNDIYTSAGNATTAAGIGGFGGDLAAVLTSKGAGQIETSVGMPLAMAGLTGNRRGTWGGIGEATAGAALTGAGIGTMIMPGIGTAIGAGIGAAAGFAASGIEKLVGIESDAQKAHDDIKSIYGVDIPTNSGTIKQIVQIAQSQFGDNVAVAVRSPSVRQMVMLYSEATGQRMPLSATTPYSGSLVEQGGKLYQQAAYQDGQAHTYASSLPTLGGIGGTSYPTPGTPNTAAGTGVTVALNINGTPITPEFVADQSMAAQDSSYGRTQQAANLQVPGLMIG
jgi:hypothetical protein